ncbi:hypothetical protein SAMN05444161_0534 [Rhizobiales bacterium GAS191]|nr:hypothetical protein SAMN05519103_08022 [Rhizobiales bacterium GAS113]SEC11457.1 hypothetical protein SAMN05444161_0534 [Rhizobiales bacterium GAS191]
MSSGEGAGTAGILPALANDEASTSGRRATETVAVPGYATLASRFWRKPFLSVEAASM